MKKSVLMILCLALFSSCSQKYCKNYAGRPYTDDKHKMPIQLIPGGIQCEFYDMGGEGVSFHDSDSTNLGSGVLNPADGSYLNEFRKHEAVDISYTKSGGIDDSPHNLIEPKMNQLYLGWTQPGEWTNYTVDVKRKGLYQIGLMYTANQNAEISLSINNKSKTGPLSIPSTYASADTIEWRQWHHWNFLESISLLELKKGKQVLTLRIVSTGQMNLDYLMFKRLD